MYVSRVLQHYEHSVTRLSLCRRGVSEWRLGKYGWDDDMEMWGVGLMEPEPKYTNPMHHSPPTDPRGIERRRKKKLLCYSILGR